MKSPIQGIEITLNDLIQVRPNRGKTGFAPRGKVNTHQWGKYQSAFKGRGMEYAESRIYQTGDDIKNIDWRVSARVGETYTKLYQEEKERPINLLVDMRSMMQFGTKVRFKAHLGAEVAAELTWVGYDGGDRVGGQILTRTGIKDFRGARTRRAILRFLESIAEQTHLQRQPVPPLNSVEKQEPSLAEGLYRLRKTSRPGSLIFIISDFYDIDCQASQEIERLSTHAHVTFIQINDVLDKSLPATTAEISDGISSIELSTLTDEQFKQYAETFQIRQKLLCQICLKNGIVLHKLQTSDTAKSILYTNRTSAKSNLGASR